MVGSAPAQAKAPKNLPRALHAKSALALLLAGSAPAQAKIEAVEDDDAAVAQLGAGHASRQCVDLLGNGVAGLHFYTLNRSTAPRAIFEEIREML